jgi:hypothetical protein
MSDEACANLAQFSLQAGDLAAPAEQGSKQEKHAGGDARRKKSKQHDRQWRLPSGVKKETDVYRIGISDAQTHRRRRNTANLRIHTNQRIISFP